MGQTINVFPATQLNGGRMVSVRVLVTDGATQISDQTYVFDANSFSCVYDAVATNSSVIHFGPRHALNVTNNYSAFAFNSVAAASSKALAIAIVTDIATYTT